MKTGLYEHLITLALQHKLDQLPDPRLFQAGEIDPGDEHTALAQFLEHALVQCLAAHRGKDGADARARLVRRVVATLAEEIGDKEAAELEVLTPFRRLLAVRPIGSAADTQPARPDTPLSRSALLTGTRHEPGLGSQLRKEIATADRVDVLCSFIKWSGLRVILDELRTLAESEGGPSPRIRVITTSYMGATDPRAVEILEQLPRTEIRVSYDSKRTRLHAKAYIFHRDTGFGSAYVGSANLSSAALSEGLEWTTKMSQYELPYLWDQVTGTFETYWQDAEFEPYSSQSPARLREAIARERDHGVENVPGVLFDVHPYPFQDEILDAMEAERRVQSKFRHLVVAATGTGKTMIAAFDYERRCRALERRPSLLFVAHREEILKQALGSFRGVLRDQNFGDLLVGEHDEAQSRHLFCSIQSYNSRALWNADPAAFEYVVVDEFHHAAAPSYRRLLDHVQPTILLGLTATPERSDQLDVLQWFDGRATAEIRLPDAINRRLLCPFQYFGVSDSVDLDQLTWQRGGYRVEDLDGLYTGNDVRAHLVVEKVHNIVLNPRRARGLGFCVSIAHAEYMARFFNERGIPARALSSESPPEDRNRAQAQLRNREVNFLFVVDLYNEGVDIPEIDTVLFLRPTESLTVFLQQLGRGLRTHPDKECLTVLDFIGAHRREFRFAARFRALGTDPLGRIDHEIENGCPNLPGGCSIRLERIAQDRVLKNIRESLRLVGKKLAPTLRELGQYLGRAPTLNEALDVLGITLPELLRRGSWSALLAEAGLRESQAQDPDGERLAKGLARLSLIDDSARIRQILDEISRAEPAVPDLEADRRVLSMLHVVLWGKESLAWPLQEASTRLRRNPAACSDLREILQLRLAHAPICERDHALDPAIPLAIHAQYSRDEVLVALGHWNRNRAPDLREGVLHLNELRLDVFFVTLRKTEKYYSPTTLYEDYLISPDRFHWQSQSRTSADSETGRRYIRHREQGYVPLLFVRETEELPGGLTSPYVFLGACDYLYHQGNRPMSIVWKLRHHVPARLFRTMATQAVV